MRRRLSLLVLSCATAVAQDGAAIYRAKCAECHDKPEARVPAFSALRAMGATKILQSIETGAMKTQAAGLSSIERHALLVHLVTPDPAKSVPPPASALCAPSPSNFDPAKGASWSGWGADLRNTRFQDAAAAGISAADVPKLKLKWSFGLGLGIMAYSQPVVAGGRIYVGSQVGGVHSLDARSGCLHWSFDAEASVRTAVVIGTFGTANRAVVFFGDGIANAYAIDAVTGKQIWKTHVDDHFAARVTGSPLLHAGVLYVPVASFEEAMPTSPTYDCCTGRGSVVALDAATGKQIWKTYTIAETPRPTKKSKSGAQMYGPSGATIWSAPTLDEKLDRIYVATGNNFSDPVTKTSDAVLGLDRKTGKLLWSRQFTPGDASNSACSGLAIINCPDSKGPDYDFGQPPILVTLGNGRRALVLGQKSGHVYALDPDRQGEVLWEMRAGKGGFLGGIQWGSAADREHMYVATSDIDFKGIVADKSIPEGYRLDPNPTKGGGLFAVKLATGATVWEAKPAPCGTRPQCSPAQSAAVTAITGVVFSGSLDGHFRAYSSSTGEVLWDFDTVRDYETVNGQKARGGSLDGPGAAVAGGMVFVNSGYGAWGGVPGNVLLAFSVEGK